MHASGESFDIKFHNRNAAHFISREYYPGRLAAPGLRALVATMGGMVPLRWAWAGGGTRFFKKLP